MQCGGGGRVGLVGRHQGEGGEGGCLPVGGGGMPRPQCGGGSKEENRSPPPTTDTPFSPPSLPFPAGHPVGGSEERGGDGGYGFPWMDRVGSDEWTVVVVGVGDGRRVPKAQYSGGSGHPTPDQTGTSQSEEWWW